METVFVLQYKSNKDRVTIDTGLSRVPLLMAGYLSFSPIKLLILKTLPLFQKHKIRDLVSGYLAVSGFRTHYTLSAPRSLTAVDLFVTSECTKQASMVTNYST